MITIDWHDYNLFIKYGNPGSTEYLKEKNNYCKETI